MVRKDLVRYTLAGGSIVVVLIMLFSIGSIVQNVGADEIVVIQSPISGELKTYTTEGVKIQGWGHVTKYKKASQIDCIFESDQGHDVDLSFEPLEVRFNDAGKAHMGASVRWEMPLEHDQIVALHRKYNSQAAIERDLVLRTLERSAYMTGPLYSSRESYAEKRGELLQAVEDQASNGIYKTRVHTEKTTDPLTGEEKTVDLVELVPLANAPGGWARQTNSPLDEFGVRLVPGTLTINKIEYDESVQAQINAQQDAIMKVQTAIAKAKEAEQNTITVAEQGKAKAAEKKWEQEALKSEAVTKAEAARDVAGLKKAEAEFYKQEQILRGEGDATRKRLVIEADGALEQKLKTYEAVQGRWADAVSKYTGNWVPQFVQGGAAPQAGSGADQLIELLKAKTARDLSLDLTVPKGNK